MEANKGFLIPPSHNKFKNSGLNAHRDERAAGPQEKSVFSI